MSAEMTHQDRFLVRMKRIRKLRGMSQGALAEACGFNRAVLTKMETGHREGVTINEAVAISAALGVDLLAMLSPEPMRICTETAVD